MTVQIDGDKGITNATWTSNTRPAMPNVGQQGFNTTLNLVETWTGGNVWAPASGVSTSANNVFTGDNTFSGNVATGNISAGNLTATGNLVVTGNIVTSSGQVARTTQVGNSVTLSANSQVAFTGLPTTTSAVTLTFSNVSDSDSLFILTPGIGNVIQTQGSLTYTDTVNGTTYNGYPLYFIQSSYYYAFLSIACSSDGSIVYMAGGRPGIGSTGVLYKSTNGGVTFTDITTVTNMYIYSVDCSSDGSIVYMVAGQSGAGSSGNLYKSTNGGTSFSTITTITNMNLKSIACSSDGSIVYMNGAQPGAGGSGVLYKSTNGGTSFTDITTITYQYLTNVTCSSDGSIVYMTGGGGVGVGGSGVLYKSTNGGTSFTDITTITNQYLRGTTCSSDGSILFMLAGNSEVTGAYALYKSTNGGTSFTNITTTSDTNDAKARSIACISDASTFYIQGARAETSSSGWVKKNYTYGFDIQSGGTINGTYTLTLANPSTKQWMLTGTYLVGTTAYSVIGYVTLPGDLNSVFLSSGSTGALASGSIGIQYTA